MGQYLAIGLVTEIGVDKKDLKRTGRDVAYLQRWMTKDLYYVPDLYEVTEDRARYCFALKGDVLLAQLLPFLREVYPHLYPKSERYTGILDQLAAMPPSEWLEWAKSKPAPAFQQSSLGATEILGDRHEYVPLHYEWLLLSLEGKVMMEEYGRQFNFIKYTMMQAFKRFSLAGALRISIMG